MRRFRLSLARVFTFALVGALLTGVASAGTFEFDSADGNTRAQARDMKRKIRAAMFLHRATFGPTLEEIDALAEEMRRKGTRRACEEWIDDQMALPASLHQPLTIQMYQDDGHNGEEGDVFIQRYKYHAWWHNATKAPDQLRQRMAWALIQILVTSEDGAGFMDRSLGNGRPDGQRLPRWLGVVNYYDLMVSGAFGNYRDLLEDVTYHPIMGVYLSHLRNRKSDGVRFPDENYAREIMQLFTIGLYELRLDGRLKTTPEGELISTYDNDTIQNFARIFTGLTQPPSLINDYNTFESGNDFTLPMVMYQNEHDTEPKELLNEEVVDEPGSDGDAEIAKALDNLMAHDNVAPFISYRLIQRFVKSNPSRGYIRRVAKKFNNNGQGVKGDLAAVVKAILLDPEAWRSVRIRQRRNPDRLEVSARGTEYSRLREPMLRYSHFLRASNVSSEAPGGRIQMRAISYAWTQESYRSPSVFNFWLSDYQPAGELIGFQPSRRIPNGNLVAPEFQLKTSVTSNSLMQRYLGNIYSKSTEGGFGQQTDKTIFFDFDAMEARFPTTASRAALNEATADLADELDLLHCTGTMPQEFKDKMITVINDETDWMIDNTGARPTLAATRVRLMLNSVLTSPFAAIAE